MTAATVHPEIMTVWEPRRSLSLRQARRRSRLVAGLRRLFTAGAGAAFASVFVFMALSAVEGGFFGDDRYANTQPLRMVNPRFTGRTESGGPFRVTAATAERQRGGRQLVELSSPVYRAERGTIVIAPRALYDEVGGEIIFDGDVLFSEPGGNRFTTPNMIVDLEGGRVYGQNGVTGAGPLGVVRADAYELREADQALRLTGGVRGQLPDSQNDAPAGTP